MKFHAIVAITDITMVEFKFSGFDDDRVFFTEWFKILIVLKARENCIELSTAKKGKIEDQYLTSEAYSGFVYMVNPALLDYALTAI